MNNNLGDIGVNISAGSDKKKYYECDDINCTFENLNNNQKSCKENTESKNTKEEQITGEIIVTSILDCDEHQCLDGVKINLYKINGLSPILIDSKVTGKNGKVIFSKIENGSYRIIELVDKRYFEKPKYKKWNEITIDSSNKTYEVLVINKVKRFAVK